MKALLGLFRLADDLLRGRSSSTNLSKSTPISFPGILLLLILCFGTIYGGIMGTYGGISEQRALQVLYSGAKVPLLLIATFVLSLPSFFVINTLLGLRSDFGQVVRALMSTQAGLTVILTALAPMTAFWYVSGSRYPDAILFNGLMFALASFSAQWMLRRAYFSLIQKDLRHRWMLRTWIVIYVFVGIQMGWVLRPFIGDPTIPVQFFRADSWSNAYEVVIHMIWQSLQGQSR